MVNNRELTVTEGMERAPVASSGESGATRLGKLSQSSGEMMRDSGEVKAQAVEDAVIELETQQIIYFILGEEFGSCHMMNWQDQYEDRDGDRHVSVRTSHKIETLEGMREYF